MKLCHNQEESSKMCIKISMGPNWCSSSMNVRISIYPNIAKYVSSMPYRQLLVSGYLMDRANNQLFVVYSLFDKSNVYLFSKQHTPYHYECPVTYRNLAKLYLDPKNC